VRMLCVGCVLVVCVCVCVFNEQWVCPRNFTDVPSADSLVRAVYLNLWAGACACACCVCVGCVCWLCVCSMNRGSVTLVH